MQNHSTAEAVGRAKAYIDSLTIHSKDNIPSEVVSCETRFFSWDNEKRTPSLKPYLFDWSYYNGVVMEGLYDIYLSDPEHNGEYLDYVRDYFNGLITEDEQGNPVLDRNLAGYVDYHGADCYKTAGLLIRLKDLDPRYAAVSKDLYRDLTDPSHKNSKGNIIAAEFTEEALGGNYWHSWAGQTHPKYKVWLDGIYMIQPFLARFAAWCGDEDQIRKILERFRWVSGTMLAPTGMYYHAANSAADFCDWHWLRAMGWYAMAMIDVIEALPEKDADAIAPALKLFVDGMLPYRDESGMWKNLADRPLSETNRLETSGTSMMVYTILKAVRLGFLDDSYREGAVKGFNTMVSEKLKDNRLTDIYLMATANGTNNYENPDWYLPDEGKGVGPFIMAYSEMLYL